MEQCTLFVLGSQYVLFGNVAMACFNPQWPNLIFAVACFVLRNDFDFVKHTSAHTEH